MARGAARGKEGTLATAPHSLHFFDPRGARQRRFRARPEVVRPEVVRQPDIDPSALCESGWIGSGSRIGPGAYIGACAELGRDCRVGEGAMIGAAHVGDGVTIEPGARILGPVTIGTGARVCAGLTVMNDVAAGAVFDGASLPIS